MQITEQFILLQAPNSAAVDNGRKLSRNGSFSSLRRTQDDTLRWAECAGSGKNPYRTSIDWQAADSAPVCRCSCPSRQLPCKHAIGLMFEILSGKEFTIAEAPSDILEKRAKQAARTAKKEESAVAPEKPKKSNASAQKKKILRQLEGLEVARKMVDDLLTAGVGTLSGSSALSFDKLAKELGNYYLTGPQTAFQRIALAVREIQQHPEQANTHYAEALRILIALHATIKKSSDFLNGKLESGDYTAEDSMLFEALGGIWRLEDLQAIGCCRENARLIQLSFDVYFDAAKQEYVERGFWMDIDDGTICHTLNLRPVKALKYVRADDSCFELTEIPLLCEYPGERNRRVRWDGCSTRPLTEYESRKLPSLATASIAEAAKIAKNQMMNTLMPKYIPVLLAVGQIGTVADELVLCDPSGGRILLRDRREDGEDHASVHRLRLLPHDPSTQCAMFGLMFFDESDRRICLHPYSLVTPEKIIRLQY